MPENTILRNIALSLANHSVEFLRARDKALLN